LDTVPAIAFGTYTDTTVAPVWLAPLVSQSGVVFTMTGMIDNSPYALRLFNTSISYESTHSLVADASGAATINISTEFSPLAATYTLHIKANPSSTTPIQTFTVVIP
jgi:hypothetical protein